jgi:hypothetical protein
MDRSKQTELNKQSRSGEDAMGKGLAVMMLMGCDLQDSSGWTIPRERLSLAFFPSTRSSLPHRVQLSLLFIWCLSGPRLWKISSQDNHQRHMQIVLFRSIFFWYLARRDRTKMSKISFGARVTLPPGAHPYSPPRGTSWLSTYRAM